MEAPGALVASGTEHGPDRQHRLEASRAGRLLISAFLVVTVFGMVVPNLPAGAVQHRLSTLVRPYVNAVSIEQSWNMFAPEPRKEILYLAARVVHADGRVTIWTPPLGGPLLDSYRDAHWRKFVEHAVVRPGNAFGWPQLWEPLARYVAAREAHDGSPPVTVTLVKRSAFINPPGRGLPDHTPFREQAYYTLRLR